MAVLLGDAIQGRREARRNSLQTGCRRGRPDDNCLSQRWGWPRDGSSPALGGSTSFVRTFRERNYSRKAAKPRRGPGGRGMAAGHGLADASATNCLSQRRRGAEMGGVAAGWGLAGSRRVGDVLDGRLGGELALAKPPSRKGAGRPRDGSSPALGGSTSFVRTFRERITHAKAQRRKEGRGAAGWRLATAWRRVGLADASATICLSQSRRGAEMGGVAGNRSGPGKAGSSRSLRDPGSTRRSRCDLVRV